MKKINYKKWFIIAFVSLFFGLLGFALLKGENEYIAYLDFYERINNEQIETIFYTDSDKIRFKEKNNDKIFITDNPRKENFKEEMLFKGIEFKEGAYLGNAISNIFGICLIGFVIFMVYKSANKTEKNAISIKEFEQEDKDNIFFRDIAGNEEAKENSKDIVDFLKYPEKYERLGARVPRGIIFYGQPGTGKTLMARAIASEAGVPFYSVCGSDFVEMYVGVGAARIRSLFKKAKEHKKAVIFIDEIDALGKKRATSLQGGNEEREQTLNALLTEMSGFSSNDGIVVIATTNRIDILDDALIRAGRFDRHIEIGLPDKTGREKIISLLLNNKEISDDVYIDNIAKKTIYFSGAMLESLINEASIMAIKDNSDKINKNHIDKAYLKVLAGDEKKDRTSIREKDKEITAFHEAGHAVITKFLDNNNTVSKISIIPTTKGAGGFCLNIFEDKLFSSKKDLEKQIMINYGGRASEEIIFGKDNITTGAYNDIEKATKIIIDYVSKYAMFDDTILNYSVLNEKTEILNKKCKEISNKLYKKTKQILEDNKIILERLANELIKKETLDEKEIEEILSF